MCFLGPTLILTLLLHGLHASDSDTELQAMFQSHTPYIQATDAGGIVDSTRVAPSWCYGKKKYIALGACCSFAVVAGLGIWQALTKSPDTTTCSGEDFWPVSANLTGTTGALFKNLTGSEAFFALMSNLWILAYNQNTISGTCPPSSLIFQQKLSEFSYAIDNAVDQVALRQGIQSNGPIGCTTIADTCEFECQYRQELSSTCAVAPIYRNKLCSLVPTSNNYGKQVAILFCDGVTSYNFYAPSKNFLVTATMPLTTLVPATSTSTTRALTTSTTALVPTTVTTTTPVPTQFIPVGNCTYYDEYLAKNNATAELLNGRPCNSTQLFLIYKSINAAAAATLAPALQQLTSLNILSFSGSKIGDAGVTALAPALRKLTNLQIFNLYWNEIGDAGVAALAPALSLFTKLQYLYLYHNSIGDAGTVTLASALQNLTNLQEVDLSGNNIGISACDSFKTALIGSPSAKISCCFVSPCTYSTTRALTTSTTALVPATSTATTVTSTTLVPTTSMTTVTSTVPTPTTLAPITSTATPVVPTTMLVPTTLMTTVTSTVPAPTTFAPTTTLVPTTVTSTTSVPPTTLITTTPQPTTLGGGNCTYYSEYLAQNSIARDLLAAVTCGRSTSLSLSGKRIGDSGVAALTPALQQLTNLLSLTLDRTKIGDEGAATLALVLKHLTGLKSLSLFENAIGNLGAKALALSFQNMTNLEDLDLSFNVIGDTGAVDLAFALAHLTKLKTIGIELNNIGICATFNATARQGSPSVLVSCNDGGYTFPNGPQPADIPTLNCTYYAEYLSQNSAVESLLAGVNCATATSLNLHHESIGDAGAAALAPALQQLMSLNRLSLYSNRIGDAGVVALTPALQELFYLTLLDLSNNAMGDIGATALASVFPTFYPDPALNPKGLTSLDLSRNVIGDIGATELASSLTNMTGLTSLDLSSNIIGDTGATALASALSVLTFLKSIIISSNSINTSACVSFNTTARQGSPNVTILC